MGGQVHSWSGAMGAHAVLLSVAAGVNLRDLERMRAAGPRPTFWVDSGTLTTLAGGVHVADVEAFEVAFPAKGLGAEMGLVCRKLIVFRDPRTGETMAKGQSTLVTPWQQITASSCTDRHGLAEVQVRGSADGSRASLGTVRVDHRRSLLGGLLIRIYSAQDAAAARLPRREQPFTLTLKGPLGLQGSYGGSRELAARATKLEWHAYWREAALLPCRRTSLTIGTGPRWLGSGSSTCIMELRGRRTNSFQRLPRWLQDLVRADPAEWLKPHLVS